jgi:SAM-dependent methyltransferase
VKPDVDFPEQYSMLALAESFYLKHILRSQDATRVLATLRTPASAEQLAGKHRLDPRFLEAALRMLAQRTPFLRFQRGKYNLTGRYDSGARAAFHQYLGAYRTNAVELAAILRDPSIAEGFVNRQEHARAFERTQTLSATVLIDLIIQLGLNHVLDLGCGTGGMLLELAERNPRFEGWGVDFNPWMCAAARRQVKAGAAKPRIRILRGDCRDLATSVPKAILRRIQTITAASLANEFCGDEGASAIAWLTGLKSTFPGRTLLISDYYGYLGGRRKRGKPNIALHDFAQLISGQGIPPPDLAAWKKIYRMADCAMVHAIEDRASSFFAHVIKL